MSYLHRKQENSKILLTRRDALVKESKNIEEVSKKIDDAYQNAQRALLYRSREHEHVSVLPFLLSSILINPPLSQPNPHQELEKARAQIIEAGRRQADEKDSKT